MRTASYSISMKLLVAVVVAVAVPSSSSPVNNNFNPSDQTTTTTGRPRASNTATGSQNAPPAVFSSSRCLPIHPDGKADAEGINGFGLDVFRQLSKGGNVFFSPFNLWSALALAYLGAEGETSTQMSRLLGLRGKRTALDYLDGLEEELSGRFEGHKNLSLETASKIYINAGYQINSCLHSALSKRLEVINFSKLTEAANIINNFVNASTKGLIPTIVKEDQLTNTQMAIISAIYFYGSWVYAFDPSQTFNANFYRDPNSQRADTVKMMTIKRSMTLGKSNELNARILRLPYTTGSVAMYILLPTEAGSRGFDATLQALNPTTLQKAFDGLSEALVEVQLPKFKMEAEYEEKLKKALKNLGATHMFDMRLADLSSFSPDVYISTVAHKAVVDVSEAGTEAAAVTAVFIDLRSSRAEAQPFICDRPFMFVIYDDVAKVMLFAGAYKTPPSA